jgi:3-oxoadipate enol-lactonase
MPHATVNGVNINYGSAGSGTPFVLIHGHPFDRTMWEPQVKAFSPKYNIITPDLRGFGKSSLPGTPTKFEDYATDVLCLLDHLKIESFHLCGLSMGGQVIMEIFRQAPSRIKTMIFADTFAGLDTPEVKQGRYNTANRLEKEGMGLYAKEVLPKMIMPKHVASKPEMSAGLLKMMENASPVGAAAALRARAERINYLTEVLPQINIPALVIVGREDEFTPVVKAEELKQNLKQCKLVIIEEAGHLPTMEQPREFNTAVLDFLAGIK